VMEPGRQEVVNADLEDLAGSLTSQLGAGFMVIPTSRYVAIAHPALGLAAVVPLNDEQAAKAAAADLTAIASSVGVAYPSMHFAISSNGKPPWVVRRTSVGIDILTSMARGAATRPPFGADAMTKVMAAVSGGLARKLPEARLDKDLLRMIEACVEKALGGKPAFVAGLEVSPGELIGPRFLLPALLVAAAQDWSIPVVASGGKGGFFIKLEKDDAAVLGYRVVGVAMSNPLLLCLPLVNLVRRSRRKGQHTLDGAVESFVRFLRRNGLDTSTLGEVDVRVATT